MGERLSHRGPDGQGIWVDAAAGVGLTHRRLAVLDLSPNGAQPMLSPSERYVLIFNGEIYNHLSLRRELEKSGSAPAWRGHSDTETLLAGFDSWGIEPTIRRTVGMFAFALWDRERREIVLGRDRLGEKPLYYGWFRDCFLFASEPKALRVHPAFSAPIDQGAVALLVRHNYIPAPYSIYQGLRKLLPGSLLFTSSSSRACRISKYWDSAAIKSEYAGSMSDAVGELETLLQQAVQAQVIADVPLGAFLSGGIDSSTVVALMQAQSSRPVKTFTIGFDDASLNEAAYAEAVAKHLGTDHVTLHVTSQDALNVVPKLSTIYSEPFADSSQVPTCLVSALARKHVTVSLSGDGADELFGGYDRYRWIDKAIRKVLWMPARLRTTAHDIAQAVPAGAWNRLSAALSAVLPKEIRGGRFGDRVAKAAELLLAPNSAEFYRMAVSNSGRAVRNAAPHPTNFDQQADWPSKGLMDSMMALDLVTYLPDDILCKVDRAAMAVGLESRVPFLDHRVVEFARRLPVNYKVVNGVGKWPVRQVLDRYVPRKLVERPKKGFAAPIGTWLRGPLRDWGEHLLSIEQLHKDDLFDVAEIRRKWTEHLTGRRNWQNTLWSVLMFQAWRCEQ